MGRHFGNLAKVRHIITYSISPFEQRAFPNYFSKGIPNVWRRFSASFFKVAPRKSWLFQLFKMKHLLNSVSHASVWNWHSNHYLQHLKLVLWFSLYCTLDIPNKFLLAVFFSLFPAMALMYLTYTWGNSVHEQGKRKNPADYENDE